MRDVQEGLEVLQRRLAKRLRQRREELGITQEQAAERAGLHPKHIQRLEAGKANATLTTLVALSLIYDVPVHQLIEPTGR